jgi:hypothetical protein
MASNNYLITKHLWDFKTKFHVLDAVGELPTYPDVEDEGSVITGQQLKVLIAESDSLTVADAGNGLEALVLRQQKRTRVVVPCKKK